MALCLTPALFALATNFLPSNPRIHWAGARWLRRVLTTGDNPHGCQAAEECDSDGFH